MTKDQLAARRQELRDRLALAIANVHAMQGQMALLDELIAMEDAPRVQPDP